MHTAILWAITKSPGAACKRQVFAIMNIFHSRETPKKTTRGTQGRHVCFYVINATRNFVIIVVTCFWDM